MDLDEWIFAQTQIKTMKAYLSGAMEFAKNEGANWMEKMTFWLDRKLAHSVYNPVVESQSIMKEYNAEDYREWKNSDSKKYANFIRVCVDRDIKAVRNSVDYLICLWDESVFKGAGTHAEVTLAYDCKKPVYLINKIGVSDLSGWIMACSSEIFPEFDELKSFLLDQYSSKLS